MKDYNKSANAQDRIGMDLENNWKGYAHRRGQLWLVIILAVCFLTPYSCDHTFQPIREDTSYPFSIYGFLDASVDTQWVRITPPRGQITMPPVKPEMYVTLENTETGNKVVMNDSLFQLPNGVNFVNAWTTMDIKPGHTYRLVAENPEGNTSSVTVTTPEDVATPEINYLAPFGCEANVYIDNMSNLADVQFIWTYQRTTEQGEIKEIEVRIPYRDRVLSYGRVLLSNSKYDIKVTTPGAGYTLSGKHVYIAWGGPEWNEDVEILDLTEFGLPNGISNVENGAGYMIGIVSKTIPYERCS